MPDGTTETLDEAIDRIVLDIKALGVQAGSDQVTATRVRERLLASHDEDLKRFVAALELRRPRRPWGQVLIALGEIILGAFLTVGGLVLIVPAVLGLSSRSSISKYLADLALGLSGSGLSGPLIAALLFGLALFLLLAALYTLRQASLSLEGVGAPARAD